MSTATAPLLSDLDLLRARERALDERRLRLRALWNAAPTADRLCAIDRLLREHALGTDDDEALSAVQDRVRDAWARARVAKQGLSAAFDVDVCQLACRFAEAECAQLLEARGLFDVLFKVCEGYLLTDPYTKDVRPFRDLWQEVQTLKAKQRAIKFLEPVFESTLVQ